VADEKEKDSHNAPAMAVCDVPLSHEVPLAKYLPFVIYAAPRGAYVKAVSVAAEVEVRNWLTLRPHLSLYEVWEEAHPLEYHAQNIEV
jgi:hypothetical protein